MCVLLAHTMEFIDIWIQLKILAFVLMDIMIREQYNVEVYYN